MMLDRTHSKNIIYIDESGISSNIGNSVYVFIFVDYDDHEIISKIILDIEKELCIPYIHWTEMPWRLKIKLSKKLVNMNFYIRFTQYKNPIFPEKAFMRTLNSLLCKEENIYKIIIDGKKNDTYKRKLKKVIRDYGFKVSRIKIVNDKSEPLLRITDFIAGLIRLYVDSDHDKLSGSDIDVMYKTIKNKIELSV